MSSDPKIRRLLADFLPDAQAIEHQAPPLGARITLYALLALVLTALLWATFAQIDKLVIGRGRLVTPLPNIVVQPLEQAILKTIQVRVGQTVRKGAVLATLDPTFAEADASQLGARSDSLGMRARRLEAELQGRTPIDAGGAHSQQAHPSVSAVSSQNGPLAGGSQPGPLSESWAAPLSGQLLCTAAV